MRRAGNILCLTGRATTTDKKKGSKWNERKEDTLGVKEWGIYFGHKELRLH